MIRCGLPLPSSTWAKLPAAERKRQWRKGDSRRNRASGWSPLGPRLAACVCAGVSSGASASSIDGVRSQGHRDCSPQWPPPLILVLIVDMALVSTRDASPQHRGCAHGQDWVARSSCVGLRGGYTSAKQNFQPHNTKNYCGYRSWNYH